MNRRFSFQSLPIRYKMLVGYSMIFLLVILGGAGVIWYFSKRAIQANIHQELQNTTDALWNLVTTTADASIRNHLRAVAETNLEIARDFYERAEAGEMTAADARVSASRVLLSQTIGVTGYNYCLSSEGIVLVHPKPQLVGADLSRHDFVQEQMRMEVGYLEYEWKNPGEDQARPKALYMIYFEPWDWIISASSYRDEFTKLVHVDEFSEEVLSTRIGETGYPFLMDSRGNQIIHPTTAGENLIDETDAEGVPFIREICERKNGVIDYLWKSPGEKRPRHKLAVFRYIPEFDWIMVSTAYYADFYALLYRIQGILVVIGLVAVVLMIPLTLFMNGRIVGRLKPLSEVARKLARCDLSVEVTPVPGGDEIDQLTEAVHVMLVNIRDVISRAKDVAVQVNASVGEISGALAEQSATTSQQSASVSEISSTMEEFSATSAQIAENAGAVVQIADTTLVSSQQGAESVSTMMEKMEAINADNQNNIQEIMSLRKKAEEITKIMELINNIADQTRLIAFNAAIEASGAGESGKRFGVVAVEIRRLADNVTESTGGIENKIGEIQDAANHMVIASEKSTKGIQDALHSFSQTVDLLNEILNGAQETTDAAKQISLSTQQQKTATEQIVSALRDIAEGSEGSSRAINQISSVSKKLAELSDDLQSLMEKFRIMES